MPAELSSQRFPVSPTEDEPTVSAERINPFTAVDVEKILRARRWLDGDVSSEITRWLGEGAALLGPQAAGRSAIPSEAAQALEDLLALIFTYDARAILSHPEGQAVMTREGARDVIRELANRVLAGVEVDSARYKEIIEGMKNALGFHGRKLFQPVRLALAGRAGEGELDRVILLLDSGSRLSFCIHVKGTRQRMIEFCAALD